MAREIPEVVRAAAGLAATVLDEARKLPETLPGLPVRLIGLAMQHAMKVQQQYAGFVARGDELFTGLRGEDEPGLATFDDDEPEPATSSGGFRESAFDRVQDLPLDDGAPEEAVIEGVAVVVEDARETVEVLAAEAPSTDALLEEVLDDVAIEDLLAEAPQAAIPVEAALPTKKATAKKAPAKKAAPEKRAADQAPAKKTAKKAVASASAPALGADEAPTLAPRGMALSPEPSAPAAATTPSAPAAAPTPSAPAAAPAPSAPAAAPTPSTAFTATSLAAPATAPIDGYDFFSLAQLRGHLRGYAAPTVEQLLSYEQAGLAREPYLRMLRNRLERLRSESA
jgi:hypothetical protein